MYDTIRLTKKINEYEINFEGWEFNGENIDCSNILRKIIRLNLEPHYNRKHTIYLSYTRNTESLLVAFSAPVILYGTNLFELNIRRDKKRLFQLLNERLLPFLNVDIREFTVSRLDLCKNIETDLTSKCVIDSLSSHTLKSSNRKNKIVYNDAVVFKNDTETVQIYDKIEEELEKGYEIPLKFLNKNIIRIENQIKTKKGSRRPIRYGREILFGEIFSKEILNKSKELLLKHFENMFLDNLNQLDNVSLAQSIIRNQEEKDLFKNLYGVLAIREQLISVDEIDRIICCNSCPKQRSRLRKQYKRLLSLKNTVIQESEFSFLYRKLRKGLGIK